MPHRIMGIQYIYYSVHKIQPDKWWYIPPDEKYINLHNSNKYLTMYMFYMAIYIASTS